MFFGKRIVKHVNGLILVDGHGKGDAQVVVHRLVGDADGLLGNEAEVLATYAKTKLQLLVASHIQKLRHVELADIILVLVDLVVLEPDGVLVNPYGLTFQCRGKLEGFGGNRLAKLHLHRLRVLKPDHNRVTRGDDTGGVAVKQRQQGLIQWLDAFHKGFRRNSILFLAATRQETQQQHHSDDADTDSFHVMLSIHIDKI